MLRALFDQAITEGHQTTHPNYSNAVPAFVFSSIPQLVPAAVIPALQA